MSIFKRRPKYGTILLAVWLIASGVLPMLGTSIPHSGLVLNVLAIAAGVLILLDR
jgi:hypothetical protein